MRTHPGELVLLERLGVLEGSAHPLYRLKSRYAELAHLRRGSPGVLEHVAHRITCIVDALDQAVASRLIRRPSLTLSVYAHAIRGLRGELARAIGAALK
jgi:hypothetical protein